VLSERQSGTSYYWSVAT